MNITNIIKSKGVCLGLLATSLLVSSCGDLDIVPEGKTTLEKTSELELLLNQKELYDDPNEFLGIVVNETYGKEFTTVESQSQAQHQGQFLYQCLQRD